MKPCSHVVCKVCVDKLVRVAKQCIVCDHTLGDKDMIELKREGVYLCNLIGVVRSLWSKRTTFCVTNSDSLYCQALASQGAVLQKRRRQVSHSRVESTLYQDRLERS
jgi:hypothetical protein